MLTDTKTPKDVDNDGRIYSQGNCYGTHLYDNFNKSLGRFLH